MLSLLVFQGASIIQAKDDIPSADLLLTQTDSPDPVAVGETLTYKINVKNNGPSDAHGVVLRDALPRGVRLVSVEPEDRCSRLSDAPNLRDAHSIFCKLGDLANGSSTRVIIRVIPLEAGVIANTVAVEAEEPPDPNLRNNKDEEKTKVFERLADIAVTMSDSPDPVFMGETLTYRIGVKNNGPSDAHGVVLRDTLPRGVRLVSVEPADRCLRVADDADLRDGHSIMCRLGDLPNASSTHVVIQVIPPHAGTITNKVAVEAEGPADPNLRNNKASEDTRVDGPEADLSIAKSGSPNPVFTGDSLTYKINVKNHGPDRAMGVVLVDQLPRSVEFVRASPFCEYHQERHAVACKLGDLGVDSMATSTVIGVIPRKPGIIVNEATVKAEEPTDPDPTNNRAAVRTMVNPADLMVVKEDVHDPVFVGERLVYNMEVTNRGPATSMSVMLIDRLPESVKLVSVHSSQGKCGDSVVIDRASDSVDPAHMVRCGLGRLAPGDSAKVEIVVVPQRPGTIVNKASVSSNEPDPNMDNNTAREETTVLPSEEACFGMPVTIMGTPGNDILIGTNKDDVIMGLGGNDIIIGKQGDDRICAGAGNDVVIAGNGNDHASGGNGNDLMVGGTGHDKLLGEDGNDLILGLPGNDVIDCGPGDDVGIGGPGTDTVENCETTKGAKGQ